MIELKTNYGSLSNIFLGLTYTWSHISWCSKQFFWIFSWYNRATPPRPHPYEDPMRPSIYGTKFQLLVLSSTSTTLKIEKLKKQENRPILLLSIIFFSFWHSILTFGQKPFFSCTKVRYIYGRSKFDVFENSIFWHILAHLEKTTESWAMVLAWINNRSIWVKMGVTLGEWLKPFRQETWICPLHQDICS